MRKALIDSIANVLKIPLDELEKALYVRSESELSPRLVISPPPPPPPSPPPSPPPPPPPFEPTCIPYACQANCAALCPDGERIIVGDSNGKIKVRSTATGHLLYASDEFLHQVQCVATSPCGKYSVLGSGNTVYICRLSYGMSLVKCQGGSVKGHSKPVRAVAVSPDGRKIASVSEDGAIIIWCSKTGTPLATFNRKEVCSLAFNIYGTKLASGDVNGKIKIWNVIEGDFEYQFRAHDGAVIKMAFLADGKSLASNSRDGTAKIFSWCPNWRTRRTEKKFGNYANPVACIAAFSGGERVAMVNEKGAVKILNVRTKRWEGELPPRDSNVKFVEVASDGSRVVLGDGERLWVWKTKP